MSDTPRQLNLTELGAGRPGLTPVYGSCLAEAAAVCLEDQGHSPGVFMSANGAFADSFELNWNALPPQAVNTWADEEFTTEQGAYGIAALVVELVTGLTVVERSRKRTGFDYWLGEKDGELPLFQKKARLEVSGIRRGAETLIQARVREKLLQTRRSDGLRIPALVVVVEFGTPRSDLANR